MASEDSNHVQSVGRALEVLEALREFDGAGVSELSEHLGLTKSTAHSYLKTLEDRGYLEQRGDEYHVGLQFLELGGYARMRLPVYRAARDQVDKLARETGDIAILGVENEGKRLIVYIAPGSETVPAFYTNVASAGRRHPLHWTGMGKAILSTKSEAEIEQYVERGLSAATEHTITDPDALLEELERISERGYSVEDEESKLGTRSIAVPVPGDPGEPSAALSVAGPKQRLSEDRIEDDLVGRLKEAATIVDLRLGDTLDDPES